MTRAETKREGARTKDRTTGLILFGVAEVLLGVGCAFLIPLTVWAAALSASIDPAAAASLTPRRLVPGLSLYALGGAVLILGDATIVDCVFEGNTAGGGGALYVGGSSPTITGCSFIGNRAEVNDGGGVYNLAGSPTLIN